MNDDRQLLELAAKAAGIGDVDFDDCVAGYYPCNFDIDSGEPEWWNPLTDDGDALRLAVKLAMNIMPLSDSIEVTSYDNHYYGHEMTCDGQDPYAATRRAIVRAAAEIGKEMA